jgi:hypothetical protein
MFQCLANNLHYMNFTFTWPCIVTSFLTIKSTRCTNFSNLFLEMKLYMFRTVPLSIIRSSSLYTQQWYMSYRFVDNFRAGSGWNFLPDPAWKGRTPLNEWSSRRRGSYLHNTQEAHETNICALKEDRIHDPRNRTAADMRLNLLAQEFYI